MAYRRGRARGWWNPLRKSIPVLGLLAGLGALGFSAYRAGTALARLEVTSLEQQNSSLTHRLDATAARADRLEADLRNARQVTEETQKRYEAEVPSGDAAALLDLTRERIRQGVTARRLAEVVTATGMTIVCNATGRRRRFAIQLAGTQRKDTASLLEGLVMVTATLPSAQADVARDAIVTVATAWSEKPIQSTGLPFSRDIPINNVMLRLTVEASEISGYATVALSTCPHPS